MDSSLVNQVCKQVYRQYKEFSGARPSITSLPNGASTLVFHTAVETANGKTMNRELRVTVDARGRIVKTSTSR